MTLGHKDEVHETLPPQCADEPLHMRRCVRGAVGNRDARDAENLVEPSVEGTTVRLDGPSLLGPASVLAVDTVVVVQQEPWRPAPCW